MKGKTKIGGQVDAPDWKRFQSYFEINGHTKNEALT